MKTPLIPWAKPTLFEKEKEYMLAALESTWISDGSFVDQFEKNLSNLHNNLKCVTTSSGTAALQLALLALNIGEGDDVIVPGYTFAGPINMVLAQKARPVFVDINPHTWCIDAATLELHITPQTKAILLVHIYGNVCNIDSIREIANKHNLVIIEDAAQAIFSKYKNQYAGTFGDIGCFSTQATKTITTGEGGFIMTPHKHLDEKCRIIRNHGVTPNKKYWHERLGFNFRLTNIQAALGCAQLENMRSLTKDKKRVHVRYKNELKDFEKIRFQEFTDDVAPVIWSTTIQLHDQFTSTQRNTIIEKMLTNNIECRPGYYAFNDMPLYNAPELKESIKVSQSTISLPSYPSLSDSDINFVAQTLKNIISNDL